MAKLKLWVGSIICTLLALVHIAMFPLVSISTGEMKPRGTYFEENSLLPSLATSTYSQPLSLDKLQKTTKSSIQLCQFLESEGLPCYHGSSFIWSVVKPYFIDEGKEVLVLVALSNNDCSIAAHLIALLKHMKHERWLTKSVVLLVPLQNGQNKCTRGSNASVVVDDWLSLFEGDVRGSNTLLPVSGTIRAAVAIDIGDASCNSKFDVRLNVVGNKGQLPNMDLPNLVSQAFKNFISIESDVDDRHAGGQYSVLLRGMLHMFSAMLQSLPSVHGSFLHRGIDAVTVELLPSSAGGRHAHGTVSVEGVMKDVEAVIRSLNMAEQKLTHGFFLYTLMTPGYFVSIGEFSITVTLIMASYALLALGSFPHIQTLIPTLQLLTASYVTAMICDCLKLFTSVSNAGCSILVIMCVAMCVRSVIDPPCSHATLFLVALWLGCLNATHAFQNISIALITPPLGLLCCVGLLLQEGAGVSVFKRVLVVAVWLTVALVLACLLAYDVYGRTVFIACIVCHITTAISCVSLTKRKTT